MKIAISATGNSAGAAFNPRFGRCEFFLVWDDQANNWQAHANPALQAHGGAGTQAAQFIANLGVQAVISGRFGPNAYTALEAAGVQTYIAQSGTVQDVLQLFQAGNLQQVDAATGPEMHRRGGRHRA
ncbi:MAG: NifB/NifX family molybdenum-iron cluster-binding protein [Anaerolineales bacterium]|nr:NifB/NifX family molybdenum-iron cluster-binding protein [Anaerolineales bacterium]